VIFKVTTSDFWYTDNQLVIYMLFLSSYSSWICT